MKKFLNVILFILVIVIFLLITIMLPNYDKFLSEKVFTSKSVDRKSKPILFSDNNYIENGYVHPVFSVSGGNVQIMHNGNFINLLPEGYSVKSDSPAEIFRVLLQNDNFCISKDGKKAAYLLTFNKISVLFVCNLETGKIETIDEKVDSFAISNDGSYVVYTTGYLYSNTLFVYKDGQSDYVAENVSAFYESDFDQVAFVSKDGCCSVYSVYGKVIKNISEGVTEICLPNPDGSYNYPSQKDTFSLYFQKDDGVYCFTANDKETVISGGLIYRLECSFKQAVPYKTFSSEKGIYKFYNLSGDLLLEDANGLSTVTSDVVAVYRFDGISKFVLGTKKGIYFVDSVTGEKTELVSFKNPYRNCENMIINNISVSTEDFCNFYICAMDKAAFVIKKNYPESWLNRFNKYSYNLISVRLQNGEVIITEPSLPSSDELYYPIISGDKVFIPVKTEGQTSVYSYNGSECICNLTGKIEIMKNESGVFCADFEDSTVTIYDISANN